MPGSSAAGRTKRWPRSPRRWPTFPKERQRHARWVIGAWKCSPCGSSAGTCRWPMACRSATASPISPRACASRSCWATRPQRRTCSRALPSSPPTRSENTMKLHRPHLLLRLHPALRPERHVPARRLRTRSTSRPGRHQAAHYRCRLHPIPPRRRNTVQPRLRGPPIARCQPNGHVPFTGHAPQASDFSAYPP